MYGEIVDNLAGVCHNLAEGCDDLAEGCGNLAGGCLWFCNFYWCSGIGRFEDATLNGVSPYANAPTPLGSIQLPAGGTEITLLLNPPPALLISEWNT